MLTSLIVCVLMQKWSCPTYVDSPIFMISSIELLLHLHVQLVVLVVLVHHTVKVAETEAEAVEVADS